MKKRTMRLVALALAMSMLTLTACGNKTSNGGNGDDKKTESESGGEKILNLSMSDTPETFNPHTTASNYELLSNMELTLYRKIVDVETGTTKYVPALADGVPECQDEEFKTWHIKIGQGYTFVDGTPIDAHTVEYSIKMLNDPKLANRNVNASDIKNGSKYLNGECEWEDVGFKAIDDYTIEIIYEDDFEPANASDVIEGYTFIGTALVHPETYEACLNEDGTESTYGSTKDKLVCSGLYDLTALIQGQYFEMTKRTDGKAPLADVYTPDKVEYVAVADSNTAIQLFQNGEIDTVSGNAETFDEYPGARYYYEPSNVGIYLNSETPTSCEALKDVNLRYAMYWGLDRESVVGTVFPIAQPWALQYLPNTTIADPEDPVNSVVDYRSTKEAQAIRIDGHEPTEMGYDPELAKEYFEKAYKNNGNKKISMVAIYADSSEVSKTWAEALQDAYTELFGADKFEMKLQATPWAIMYEEIARDTMNYDICVSAGWWTNMTKPWNDTNWVYSGPYTYNTQYCVIADDALAAEWDDLFYKCALYEYKRDPQKILEASARMEEILLNDCSYIPAYASGSRYFFSSKITPVLEVGDADLTFALMQAQFN